MPDFALTQLFTSPLEFCAFVTSVACVALITIKSPKAFRFLGRKWFSFDYNWNWPIGIVTSILYFFIFWDFKLWMNAILQGFYVVSGFWGWYRWMKGFDQNKEQPILSMTLKQGVLATTAAIVIILFAWPAMIHFNDAAPFWDSVIFGLSVVAQLVMTWKYKFHWKLWLLEDVIATILFWNLGLGLTSILYFVFGCLAIRGIFTWKAMQLSEHRGRMSLIEV